MILFLLLGNPFQYFTKCKSISMTNLNNYFVVTSRNMFLIIVIYKTQESEVRVLFIETSAPSLFLGFNFVYVMMSKSLLNSVFSGSSL